MGLFRIKKTKKEISSSQREFYSDGASFLSALYKTEKGTKIVFCVLGAVMLLFFTVSLIDQLSWEHKVKNYITVQGTIVKNHVRRVRRNRKTRTVSDLEYTYVYKNRTYRGSRIVYGENFYPRRYQKGAVRPILVNPERPSESAAMIYYRKPWGFFIRNLHGLIFLAAGIGFLIAFFRSLRPKSGVFPEELTSYLARFSKEELAEAENKARDPGELSGLSPLSLVTFSRDIRFRCMERYMIVGGNVSLLSWCVCIGLCFALLLPGLFNPIFFVHLLIWGVVMFFILFPSKTVLDLHEKKIYSYRVIFPEKKTPEKCIAFEEIELLYLVRNTRGKNPTTAYCVARMKDGNEITLWLITVPTMPSFLKALPDLAEKLGNQKILFMKG